LRKRRQKVRKRGDVLCGWLVLTSHSTSPSAANAAEASWLGRFERSGSGSGDGLGAVRRRSESSNARRTSSRRTRRGRVFGFSVRYPLRAGAMWPRKLRRNRGKTGRSTCGCFELVRTERHFRPTRGTTFPAPVRIAPEDGLGPSDSTIRSVSSPTVRALRESERDPTV
jgi:hypothetical protein